MPASARRSCISSCCRAMIRSSIWPIRMPSRLWDVADAVVRQAILREIVRSDFFFTASGTDQAAPRGRVLFRLLALFWLQTAWLAGFSCPFRGFSSGCALLRTGHRRPWGCARSAPRIPSCSRAVRLRRRSGILQCGGPPGDSMSTSSASGMTATVAVEVWMRPAFP